MQTWEKTSPGCGVETATMGQRWGTITMSNHGGCGAEAKRITSCYVNRDRCRVQIPPTPTKEGGRGVRYSEKLKSPEWQKVRLKVLERDGWKCLKCKRSDKTVNVHHKGYEAGKEPWEYPLERYESLCEDCHKMMRFAGCDECAESKRLRNTMNKTTIPEDLTILQESLRKLCRNCIEKN